uniref:Phytocyanin domain-containing protein n=1 Tax=Nelumbo nucifera TaxID=4432 RepID=A0A822ZGQ8_NELNU|nr:TPA_asm: hypothetical protein HUJ06_000889 [Nelumbo nucifera]
MNVLEVNKTNYETCNENHPIHNWTTDARRDVVPLNITKTYYFISGKGFCYSGMKVAVHMKKLHSLSNYGSHIVLSVVFAIVALLWDNFIGFWH